jgi:hypothetical protein
MTRTDFNKTRIALTFLGVVLVIVQNGFASTSIKNDAAAMPGYKGSSNIDFMSDGIADGHIDYAVFAPGAYHGTFAYHNDFKQQYVYAYQIFNNSSLFGIDSFWVGKPANAPASNPVFDSAMPYAVSEGIWTDTQTVRSQSVLYIFNETIGAGVHSQTLLFTSNCAPEMWYGGITGGISGGAIVDMPTPWQVPEPATFGLLIGGALMAIRRKQKTQ